MVFHKNNPFDFLLYFCQIVDIFIKKYPVCTLENVLFLLKSLHIYLLFFANNYLIIKSKQSREQSTHAQDWINNQAGVLHSSTNELHSALAVAAQQSWSKSS